MKNIFLLLAFAFAAGTISCEDKTPKPPPPPPLVKKEKGDTLNPKQKGPIINLADTVEQRLVVICIKDSASTSARMSEKLNEIYNTKLPAAIKANKLKASGPPMAWYKTQKAPFFFEAGIPVEKAPVKAIKGIVFKKTGGDSVLVAHFFGPAELSTVGYDALNEMLKDRGRNKTVPAYEIYIDNPFDQSAIKKDAYRMQLDIVMPYR